MLIYVTSVSGKAIYVTIMFLQFSPLHLAMIKGNYDIVHLLLGEGADVNAEDGVSSV